MSHRKERIERNCLNCNAEVHGRYCHICGQENTEPKETFWHLVTHFVYDITHFDGKFFSTLKYLMFRPGFLTYEYMRGRRNSYLNPIRMYIFTSAFFFVFFFTFLNPKDIVKVGNDKATYQSVSKDLIKDRTDLQKSLNSGLLKDKDKERVEQLVSYINEDLERIKKDTSNLTDLKYYSNRQFFTFGNKTYKSQQQYDSIQNTLPEGERDGWFKRKLAKRTFELNTEYKNGNKKLVQDLVDKFMHKFPQILFISLPLFALLLQLLYVRHKKIYYADHIIFSVNLYIAMFIMIFLEIVISRLEDVSHLDWLGFVKLPLAIYIVWYIFRSLKNFYEQSYGKTVLKFFLLLFASTIVMSTLFVIFLLLSVFTI